LVGGAFASLVERRDGAEESRMDLERLAALVATGRAGQCRRKQHREPGATGGKSGGIRKTEDAPAKNVGLGDL
jgi:hypothetical protein